MSEEELDKLYKDAGIDTSTLVRWSVVKESLQELRDEELHEKIMEMMANHKMPMDRSTIHYRNSSGSIRTRFATDEEEIETEAKFEEALAHTMEKFGEAFKDPRWDDDYQRDTPMIYRKEKRNDRA